MDECRLIIDAPQPGAWNMAADEWLLTNDDEVPVLRFYQWSEPTLSLGYFQSVTSRRQHKDSAECILVRRASGGGAILHHHELTYSFTVPTHDRFARAAEDIYSLFHQTLISTLEQWGITARQADDQDVQRFGDGEFLCFQRRSTGDVVIADQKVAGSAQRRKSDKVLQHGSVLLNRSAFAPELPGINDITGADISASDLQTRWLSQLIRQTKLGTVEESFAPSECLEISEIAAKKFDSREWTAKR